MIRPDHPHVRSRSTSSNLKRRPEDFQDREGQKETKKGGQKESKEDAEEKPGKDRGAMQGAGPAEGQVGKGSETLTNLEDPL